MWSTDASDPWLSRESSILTSFVRLFPPIETANSESIHTCSNNNGDDEDDVDDNSDGEYVNKESPKRKRSPSASLQEIMMKVNKVNLIN